MLYDVWLVTEKDFVPILLRRDQLLTIDRAFQTGRYITVIVRLGNGREVEASNVLCRYLAGDQGG